MIADADWTSKSEHMNRFVSAQNNYSLLERRVEHEVTPACERFGLGMLPYFPLASGLLTGKYKRGEAPAEGTRLAAWGARAQQALSDKNFDKVEALSRLGGRARPHDAGAGVRLAARPSGGLLGDRRRHQARAGRRPTPPPPPGS